ncbi:MAG: PAS domain-containing sensor histidine kinase [Ginsengibacter sp.]
MLEKSEREDSSYNYFESLFNNAVENNVLLMDKRGIILAINEAFTNCFGYNSEDILGKHAMVLFTPDDQKKGKPEEEIATVLREGQASDDNYLVTKGKTNLWVSGESTLVNSVNGEPRILKIIQNIHQQKKSELSIHQLNTFNENILSTIEDVVIVVDANMNILKTNRAFSTLFTVDNEIVQTINFSDLIKPYDVFDELTRNIQSAIRNKKGFSNVPVEIETSAGEKRVFDVSCSPFEFVDDENNVLIVIHDITIHKQLERDREDVIGFVAHELRNPLANLVLCNDLMGEFIKENNQEEITDLLERSKNNVSRLNRMIAELYDAARINSGNLKLEISPFNFKEMILEAIDTVKVLQPSYNIVLKGEADFSVRGDRYRLIQVVTNYLGNGIKYSHGTTDVVLQMRTTGNMVTVSVTDYGLGISATQLPYIFDRFFRAEKTKNLEGIGLGLYLCRQIIHAHQGQVWVESEEGKGSTFYFSVPR